MITSVNGPNHTMIRYGFVDGHAVDFKCYCDAVFATANELAEHCCRENGGYYDLVTTINPVVCECRHGFREHRVEDAEPDPVDGMPTVQAFECRECECAAFRATVSVQRIPVR